MNATQAFLRNKGTLEDLENFYAVKVKRHPTYTNLVHLAYDQIKAFETDAFDHEITRECRGMILDEKNDWAVVCRGFDKFFNEGEKYAAPVDYSTAEIQEKVDGSLMFMWFYDGQWHVSTTGTPDASGSVNGENLTFCQLFWKTYSAYGKGYCRDMPKRTDVTYLFELTSPYNRVVIPHTECSLTLIGAREHSGNELYPAAYKKLVSWIPTAPRFDTKAFGEKLDKEGFVVCDHLFRRVKIKDPRYLEWHRAKDAASDKAFWEIVRKGENAEVLSYFPELQPQFDAVQKKFDLLKARITMDYLSAQHAETQKDFAFMVVDKPWSAALFAMRKGKPLHEFLAEVTLDWVRTQADKCAS